ncbi:hypothetical protein ACHAXN_012413 [Cyclotella atomus]
MTLEPLNLKVISPFNFRQTNHWIVPCSLLYDCTFGDMRVKRNFDLRRLGYI